MKTKNEYGRSRYKDKSDKVMRIGDSFAYIDWDISLEKCDYCVESGELATIELDQSDDYKFKMFLFDFFKAKYNVLPIGMTFRDGLYKVWVDHKKVKGLKK